MSKLETKIEQERDGYYVSATNNGYQYWGLSIAFPTEQAAKSVADAIHRAAGMEPAPYRCTILVEMPADDGENTRPEDVTEALNEMGVRVIEWHDQDLIQHDSEEMT